jgi:hypothetical protein
MTFQVQISYKPDQNGAAETELLSFSSKTSAEKFLQSVLKNPDVVKAKIV